MAASPRQQVLNLLPIKSGGKLSGAPWSTDQIARVCGWDKHWVGQIIAKLSQAGLIVAVGGTRRGYLWAKLVEIAPDNRGRPRKDPLIDKPSRGRSLRSTRGTLQPANKLPEADDR